MLRHLSVLTLFLSVVLTPLVASAYTPRAEKVAENVYAIIGPLGQRSKENDGLNNNEGFVVTDDGVVLIDSGASYLGAESIASAVAEVTAKPIKWVLNTGSQDHRWLGNAYFSARGAETIAMKRTTATQEKYATQQLDSLKAFLGERLKGTKAEPAKRQLEGDKASVTLGGVEFQFFYTDTHFPGDSMIWLPQQKVLFSGDLVFVDRLFALLPWSSAKHGQAAFHAMESLGPRYIVPGHGGVTGLAKAKQECGDYYDFLNNTVGAAAEEMEPMEEVIKRYAKLPAFEHLEHFDDLHRTNMNRTYLEYESF